MHKSFRYFIKLTEAFIKRFKGIILISILAGTLIFVAMNSLIPRFSSLNTEKIGVTGRYHTEELPNFIKEMISRGLTEINDQGFPEASLSSSWETADDGKTWNFRLKDNVYWQDGLVLTSEHINYNFNDVELIKNDDKNVTFKLKDPFSPFPSVVSSPIFKSGLLGTGNWTVKKINLIGGYVQELTLTNAQKQNMVYRFYPTTERTKIAFKLGRIDKIVELDNAEPFDSWKNVKVSKESNKNQVVTVFFNVKDNILSDKTLRQGLAYAIKKDKYDERALSPISPNSWSYNPQVKAYDYDPDRAREIVGGLPEELKNELSLKLSTTPSLLKTAEDISRDWQDVGIKTEIQVVSVIPTDFQALLTILDIPD